MTWTPIDHTAVDRPEVSRAAFGYPVVDDLNDLNTRATSLDTRVTAVESGKVPTTRTLTAGTGLTGGGDLSANRSFAVSYGTAAGTAAQGNDSRITVTQDATIGNSALGTRVSSLESGNGVFAKYRQGTSQLSIPANTWTAINWDTTDNSTASVSRTGNTFTLSKAGRWEVLVTFAGAGTGNSPVGLVNVMLSSAAGSSFGTIYAINQGYQSAVNKGLYVQTSTFLVVSTSLTVAANVYSDSVVRDMTAGGSPNIQFVYLGA